MSTSGREPLAGGDRGGPPRPPTKTAIAAGEWPWERPRRPVGRVGRRIRLFQSLWEMRAVTWPSAREVSAYSRATLILVAAALGFVSALDFGWAQAILTAYAE